ncbi:MAG: hypothetical protein EBY34_05730, partial [Alphaproteobacteria bacterium]|nr:hypothetical protein [Alphaproteobacteria bacterium]
WATAAALAALIIPWHDALAPSPFKLRFAALLAPRRGNFGSPSLNLGLVIIAAVSITTLILQNSCQRLMSQVRLRPPFIFA